MAHLRLLVASLDFQFSITEMCTSVQFRYASLIVSPKPSRFNPPQSNLNGRLSFLVGEKFLMAHLVIAGWGRCGTTMLCRAIKDDWGWVPDLNGLKPSHEWLIKSHSLPATKWLPDTTVIWLFGNPMDVIVSLIARTGHLKSHCKAYGIDPGEARNVYDQDILGLEKHFTAWYRPHPNVRVITVKYERLYSHLNDLRIELKSLLRFPPFKPRKTDWRRHWAADRLSKTYGDLAKRVEEAEGYKVWV